MRIDIEDVPDGVFEKSRYVIYTSVFYKLFSALSTSIPKYLTVLLILSRARAQAVVDALVKTHKIDIKHLAATGVASYAPLASNASEVGRAKNRRVELVLQ